MLKEKLDLDNSQGYQALRGRSKRSDRRAVDALEIAMDMPAALTVECCQQIVKYMVCIGDINKAQIYAKRYSHTRLKLEPYSL